MKLAETDEGTEEAWRLEQRRLYEHSEAALARLNQVIRSSGFSGPPLPSEWNCGCDASPPADECACGSACRLGCRCVRDGGRDRTGVSQSTLTVDCGTPSDGRPMDAADFVEGVTDSADVQARLYAASQMAMQLEGPLESGPRGVLVSGDRTGPRAQRSRVVARSASVSSSEAPAVVAAGHLGLVNHAQESLVARGSAPPDVPYAVPPAPPIPPFPWDPTSYGHLCPVIPKPSPSGPVALPTGAMNVAIAATVSANNTALGYLPAVPPPPPPPTTPSSLAGTNDPLLCPPGFSFDYDWQSCWQGTPQPVPPGTPPPDACRCEPGYSWLHDADSPKCWRHGTLPAKYWGVDDQILSNCPIEHPGDPGVQVNPGLPTIAGGLQVFFAPPTGGEVMSVGAVATAATQAHGSPFGSPSGYSAGEPPLCPDGYVFDYDWQSCWPVGVDPGAPPKQWIDACRCKKHESWLATEQRCWRRNAAPGAGTVFGGSAGSLGGTPDCGFDGVWDPDAQTCIKLSFGCESSDPTDVYSLSVDGCVENPCPDLDDVAVTWQHLPGDCTGWFDDWSSEVTAAVRFALQRIDPALRMVSAMLSGPESFQAYLWNFGYGASLDPDPVENRRLDPSMRGWLGLFSHFKLGLVHDMLERAKHRITSNDPVWIRCLSRTNPLCWGGAAGVAFAPIVAGGPGTIHLCKKWKKKGADERGMTMLHELLHYSFPGRIQNFPRDLYSVDCYHGDNNLKCNHIDDCVLLADTLGSTDWITEIHGALEQPVDHELEKAFINIQNYVWWMERRHLAWRTCTYPHGAIVP